MSAGDDLLEGAVSPSANNRLFGHDAASSFLASAYRSGRIHHAVLIEGPKGIGKATLAFRFANHALRHEVAIEAPRDMADPDPTSSIARQIASGASHNILHLTRPVDEKTGRVKSSITVDEVRRVDRFMNQTSGTGGWRIVIVDAADDLNRSAANAILKMLEEPPKRSLFLVVSHAPGRLLPTIRSRCLSLRLTPLGEADLLAALEHLGAGRGLSQGERQKVVALAQGSVARALMVLNYGGIDILQAFEGIIADGPDASRKAAHQLADTLSARDRDEAYAFFVDFLLDWTARQARSAALDNSDRKANALAQLQGSLEQELRVAEIYNLDRKQAVLSAFSSIFRTLAA